MRKQPTCPRATSVTCVSPDHESPLLFARTCKCWSCAVCARAKVRRLAWLTNLAAPNRLLTLTVDPSRYSSPREAFEQTASQVPELIRALRKRFGQVEYLRVTEVCKSGFPHYHLLVRSDYLPQPVVKKMWCEYTNAQIVDLRQVQSSFSAYWYLVKYLTKLHRKDWTERHVSYSKNFFPCPTKAPAGDNQFEHVERINLHPYQYLAQWFFESIVTQLSASAWLLDAVQSTEPASVSPADLGLSTDTRVPTADEYRPLKTF
jgi:hypothetical protein